MGFYLPNSARLIGNRLPLSVNDMKWSFEFPDRAPASSRRLLSGIREAEFAIPGQIVADIGLERPPQQNHDGSTTLFIEALTIAE